MHRSRLDREKLCIVRDDASLYRLLRIAWGSLERRVARILLTVDAEPPPRFHPRMAGTLHRAEEGSSSVHEFEIFCQFVSLSEYFKLTPGPR